MGWLWRTYSRTKRALTLLLAASAFLALMLLYYWLLHFHEVRGYAAMALAGCTLWTLYRAGRGGPPRR